MSAATQPSASASERLTGATGVTRCSSAASATSSGVSEAGKRWVGIISPWWTTCRRHGNYHENLVVPANAWRTPGRSPPPLIVGKGNYHSALMRGRGAAMSAIALTLVSLLRRDDEVLNRQTLRFIQTAFGSVKFSIAAVPCSRPRPESRSPPQGNLTSV